jgi:hypothetical protein
MCLYGFIYLSVWVYMAYVTLLHGGASSVAGGHPTPSVTWGRTQRANEMESRDCYVDPTVSGVLASHCKRRNGTK